MITVRHLHGPDWSIGDRFWNKVLLREAKGTPGMRWEGSVRAWVGYADAVWATVQRLKALAVPVGGTVPVPVGTGTHGLTVSAKDLRKYQIEAVDFLITHGEEGALLADSMGLGKTLTAIRAGRSFKERMLVVCPAFVKGVWEIALKGDPKSDPPIPPGWPAAKYMVLQGTKITGEKKKTASGDVGVEDLDVIIINYDILHAWLPFLIEWNPQTIIFDEAQYLMGINTRRSKAAREIAWRTKRRLALTGTPMQSRPRDLFNLVDTISPGRFGKPFKFYLRHAGAEQVQVTRDRLVWNFDGASNLEELGERMKFFMLRRTTVEVGLELPALTRQIIPMKVPKKNQGLIASALESDALLRRALDLAADGKIPDVIALACSHVEAGSTVVVGSHRRLVAEQIAEGIKAAFPKEEVAVVHGGMPQNKRRDAIASRPRALCCTIESTYVGISLAYANVGLVAELIYVPSTLAQWEKRFHRFGQHRPVLIQYAIADGTIDELIRDTVIKKMKTTNTVVGTGGDGFYEDFDKSVDGAAALRRLYESIAGAP